MKWLQFDFSSLRPSSVRSFWLPVFLSCPLHNYIKLNIMCNLVEVIFHKPSSCHIIFFIIILFLFTLCLTCVVTTRDFWSHITCFPNYLQSIMMRFTVALLQNLLFRLIITRLNKFEYYFTFSMNRCSRPGDTCFQSRSTELLHHHQQWHNGQGCGDACHSGVWPHRFCWDLFSVWGISQSRRCH